MNRQTARFVKVFGPGLLFALLTAAGTQAQEKSFVWVSEPRNLTIPTGKLLEWFDQDTAVLYRSHALDLIKETVGLCIVKVQVETPPGKPQKFNTEVSPCPKADNKVVGSFPGPNDYVVIHVLRWKDPVSNAQSVDKQNWYVFHQGTIGKWGPDDWDDDAYAKNNRIFGSRNVYLLYVHFNRKLTYRASYTMTAKKKIPAYLSHLFSLLQVFGMNTTGGGEGEVVPNAFWNAIKLDSYYVPSDLTFTPAVLPEPTSTSPATAANASAGTGPPGSPMAPSAAPNASATAAAAAAAPSQQTPVGASAATSSAAAPASTASPGETAPPQAVPSSPMGTTSSALPPTAAGPPGQNNPPTALPNVAANSSASSSAAASIPTEVKLDSQVFDNEGLYHFDFTVAVPIRKISEISYVSSSNTLVPTKVDKQTTFGVVDYYFKPIDIKGSGWSLYPHALAGVAIDSQPLKRVLIGGGYGPLLAHFYMGLVLNTQSLPPGASCGSIPTSQQLASGNLRNRICPGLSLGLNVSVGSVLDSLKSKSSTGSGSKAK